MDKTTDINKTTCRELLVQRMFFAIGLSIIVHFILMSGVILITNLSITHPLEWIQNTWNIVTCMRMWLCFVIFSTVVFLQGIITSKDYMNPESYASSRFVKFCHIFTPHNLLVGCLYVILGGVLAWLHLSVEGGRFGSLIKSCENVKGYCLVEEHYFLLLEGFWIGLYYFANSSYKSKNVQFPIIPQSKLSQVKRGIKTVLTNASLDAIWPTIYFLGFYSVFGEYCRNILSTPFSLSIEEMPLDKFSRLLSFSLIFYAWLHAVLFTLIIESMHILFQAYLTEWIPFEIEKAQFTEKPRITLSEAMSMEIPILQQLGYLDLVTIAEKDRSRRSIIFTLSQPGGHPYNWNNVVTKSLSLMKNFCDGLNSACITQKEQQPPPVIKPAPVLRNETPQKPYIYQMRSLVQSPMPVSAFPKEIVADIKQAPAESFFVQYYKNIRKNFINYLLSKRPISYIFAEQFENKLRHVFNNAQSVIWAADSISSLAAVSLKEDPYGIVQKDLPEIIEVLLRLRQSLDKLQKLNISIRKPISDDKFLKQTLTALRSAVRRSLYRIISQFKDYIDDLALPTLTVDQLQPFFNYKE